MRDADRAEARNDRVVHVEDQPPVRFGEDHLPPGTGERLDLSVAVQPVSEEVAENDRDGRELGRDERQPRLVHLEDANLRLPCEQGGGDPRGHVCPGLVVGDGMPRAAQNRRDHPGGGGLAVGPRDEDAASRQAAAEQPQRARLMPQKHRPRRRRTSPTAFPRARSGRFGEPPQRGRQIRGREQRASGSDFRRDRRKELDPLAERVELPCLSQEQIAILVLHPVSGRLYGVRDPSTAPGAGRCGS